MLLHTLILLKYKTPFLLMSPLMSWESCPVAVAGNAVQKPHCSPALTCATWNKQCSKSSTVWVRVGPLPHCERAYCCCVPFSVYLACPCNDRDICTATTAAATLSHSVSLCLFVLRALQSKRLSLHTMAAISSSLRRFVCSSRWVTTTLTDSLCLISSSVLKDRRYVCEIACTKIALFALFSSRHFIWFRVQGQQQARLTTPHKDAAVVLWVFVFHNVFSISFA